ncbi:unnamed protein product [Camellia sinensis]
MYGTLYQKNQELVYEFLPLFFIIPSSSSSGILNPKAKSAVAVDQKAARLICIFSATSRAHPKSSSATMQGILSLSDPLIFSMSSSSFPGMTWKIDSVISQIHFYPPRVPTHLALKPDQDKTLSISQTVFKTAGSVIDSGTVITRRPPAAYDALKTAFREQMKQYPMAQSAGILDTWYDLSKYNSVKIPPISFLFGGNVELPLDTKGILYPINGSQFCLAFARNMAASDLAIFGNVQQQTLDVVYDEKERDELAESLKGLFSNLSTIIKAELQGTNNQLELLEKMNLKVKNQELGYEVLPLSFIIPSSRSAGMLNFKAKSAAAAGQKAARLICIFSATSRAHPKS